MLGFFGRFWWFLELFIHFRVQLFLALLAAAICALLRRRYSGAVFFGVFALANFCAIIPLYLGKPAEPPGVSQAYRSLLLNVSTQTGDPKKVGRLVQQMQPDFLVLEEINERWLQALTEALHAYPYSKIEPRDDNFGLALFSKFPFTRCEIRQVGDAEVPTIIAEVVREHQPLTLIATHLLPPGGAENTHLRNDHLSQLPAIVRQASSPVLLLGDLNATPWCVPFQQLLANSGLRDARQGRGVLPTWPTFLPILLIPIDHCLHSQGIYVRREWLGPKVGSDHYPLLLDFALAPNPQAAK